MGPGPPGIELPGIELKAGWWGGALAQVRQVWLPLGGVLLAYWLAAAVNQPLRDRIVPGAVNHIGLPLHVVEPVRVDEFVFGALPTSWLQQRLYDPSAPRWYDAVVALVYVSHFVVIPAVALVLWRWGTRARFRAWIGCVTLMVAIGTTVYILYPMAPPWIAADLGFAGPADRISGIGWDYLGLSPVARLLGVGQASANPVAAMPSMHAAAAALVYTAEHYVVDVVAGGLIAVAVVIGWTAGRRWRARRATGSAQGPGTGSTRAEGSPARRRP